MSAVPVLELDAIVKDYRSLRPLRVAHLRVRQGERVGLLGFDAVTAEVLINLITGAHVPDRGTVHVFGQPTTDVADAGAWMSWLDRFGIVSDRALLLDAMTIAQNMAIPFSLDIDPVPPATHSVVTDLAAQVGLDPGRLDVKVGEADELARARVRLARALALNPAVLLLEHATSRLSSEEAVAFAADVASVTDVRRTTVVAVTADVQFARALGGRVLHLQPSSGDLHEKRGLWFRRWNRRSSILSA